MSKTKVMDRFEYELKAQDGRNDLVTFTRENFFWEFIPREVQQINLQIINAATS